MVYSEEANNQMRSRTQLWKRNAASDELEKENQE